MTDYTITTDFGAKDSLPSGNAAKVIKGSEFTTEFTNILTAVNSKVDSAGDTFTGAVTFDAAVTLNADVTFDTNTLFVDVSENKVGIGTTTPDQKLQVDGNIRLGDTATGVDDDEDYGLRTGGSLTLHANDSGNNTFNTALAFDVGNASGAQAASSKIQFRVNNTERMRIDSSGNVGLGTTNPTHNLHIEDSSTTQIKVKNTTNNAEVRLGSSSTGGDGFVGTASADNLSIITNNATRMTVDSSGNVVINATTANGTEKLSVNGTVATGGGTVSAPALAFRADLNTGIFRPASQSIGVSTNGTERMRIDSSGNVGIGTSNLTRKFRVVDATDASVDFRTTDGADRSFEIDVTSSASEVTIGTSTNHALAVKTNDSERLRIDSSGNLLVGKTATTFGTAGSVSYATGLLTATVDGNACVQLNRLTSDGVIQTFGKDGTTVGTIGTVNGDIYLGTGNVNLRFTDSANDIRPVNSSGANLDDTVDLGASATRFDDIYATNGTIQTSDRNEKQGIRELLDAEQRVATACKGLLRAFKWNSAVEEKGDEARIHFGIIAQDLQDAFTAEGLDAGDYAMFINSTWTDEETGEERSRMGVRYSELLAFIISAI